VLEALHFYEMGQNIDTLPSVDTGALGSLGISVTRTAPEGSRQGGIVVEYVTLRPHQVFLSRTFGF
jgi:hypothetical protein